MSLFFASGDQSIGASVSASVLQMNVNMKVAQSSVGLFATPWTIYVHEILQARIMEWVAFPFSRASSQPRDFPLPVEPQGSPRIQKWVSQSVQSLSRVWLFVTPWTAAHQASLSTTNSWSLLKLMSIQPVMPPNHLILCHPLLLLPLIFPNIRVFSNELALHIR